MQRQIFSRTAVPIRSEIGHAHSHRPRHNRYNRVNPPVTSSGDLSRKMPEADSPTEHSEPNEQGEPTKQGESQPDITSLLRLASQGDSGARSQLYPLVYRELHNLAAGQLSRERPGHTLQPTALLDDAYLRLVGMNSVDWASRGHFYAMAATVMRRLLISHARQRLALKRGSRPQQVDLDAAAGLIWENEPLLLALDEALSCLETESPRAYKLVELKFFAGLGFDEASKVMGVSSRTLKRDWLVAKAWLYRELSTSATA